MELFFILLALIHALSAEAATGQAQDTSESKTSIGVNAANDVADAAMQVLKAKTTITKTAVVLKTLTTTLPYSADVTHPLVSNISTRLEGNESGTSSANWWDSMTRLASSAMVSMTAPKASSVAPVVQTTTVMAETTVFADVFVTVAARSAAKTNAHAHAHAHLQHRAFEGIPGQHEASPPIGTMIWDHAPTGVITNEPLITPPPIALRKRADRTDICTDFQNNLPMSCTEFVPPATELAAITFPYRWCITYPGVPDHFCGPYFVIKKAGAVSMTFDSNGEPYVARAPSTASGPAPQPPVTQQPTQQAPPPPPAVQTTTIIQQAAPPPPQTTTVVNQAPAPAPVTTTVVTQAPAPEPFTKTIVNNAPAPEPVTTTVVANASAVERVTETVVLEAATPDPVTMTVTTQPSVSTPQPITKTVTETLIAPESESESETSSSIPSIPSSKAVSSPGSSAAPPSTSPKSSSSARPALASRVLSSSSAYSSSVRVASSSGFVTSVSSSSIAKTRICEKSSTWEWWKDTQLYTGSGECEVRESSAAEVKRGRLSSIDEWEKWEVAASTILLGWFVLWMLA